jgi:hypothetical protein
MTTTLDLGRVKDWADEDRLQLPFRVWTSRYGNKLLAQRTSLAKVGITLGEPKFPLGYEKQQLRELAPTPQQFHLADEKFVKSFRHGMYVLTIERVIALLTQASQAAGGCDLALLCFEDVRKPNEWCHRLVLARWIEDQCGLQIEEYVDDSPIGGQGPAAPKSGPKKQKRLPPTLDELKASGQVTISSQKHRAELEKLARWMGR